MICTKMTEIQQVDYQFQNKCDNLMKLLPKIQCHKCERVPGPRAADRNRYVCQNSHHLCEECKHKKCPCGSSTGGRNNPAPSTMIPLLFDVFGLPWPCQNYPKGCREILIESELENHEINCVFRLVNCVDNLCTKGAIDKKIYWQSLRIDMYQDALGQPKTRKDKKIVFKDVLDHFENDCKTTDGPAFSPAIKVEGDKNSFVFQVNLANLIFSLYLTPRKMEIQEHCVSKENSSILIKNKLTFFVVGCLNGEVPRFLKHNFYNCNRNEECHMWVYMIGSPSEAKNYTSSISIASKDGNEIYIRKGPVFTLDDDYETVMENDSIFKIKYSFAKQMLDESSKLLVQVMIHRNVEDAKF